MAQNDQLNIPGAARADRTSFELLRVWIANNAQHVSLRVGVWSDPAAWGIMLSDLTKHIANTYEQDAGLDKQDVIQRIKMAFDAEMSAPTDSPEGRAEQN